MKNFLRSSIFTSVVLFFLGLLLIFQSETTIAVISYIIGTILIAAGVFALMRYVKINTKGLDSTDLDILYGLVSIILGILVITHPKVIASIIPVILGIGIIISSSSKIQYAFNLKNADNEIWKATMLIALISTICGVVLLFNPFAGAVIIMKIVGIFIAMYSILDLISTYIIKKNVEAFQSAINESEKLVDTTYEAEVVEEKEETKTNNKKSTAKKKTTTRKKTSTKKKSTNKSEEK